MWVAGLGSFFFFLLYSFLYFPKLPTMSIYYFTNRSKKNKRIKGMCSSSLNDCWFLPGFLLLLLNDLSSWPDIAHLWLMKEGLSHCISFIHFKTNKSMAEGWWWGGQGKHSMLAERINTIFMFPTNRLSSWSEDTTNKNTLRFHSRGSITHSRGSSTSRNHFPTGPVPAGLWRRDILIISLPVR